MDQLDDWVQRLSEGKINADLQLEIAQKILQVIEQKGLSLGSRNKVFLADAITALSINVNSIYQPNEAGLERCITALRQVISSDNSINEPNAESDGGTDDISVAMLVSTIQIIKDQII